MTSTLERCFGEVIRVKVHHEERNRELDGEVYEREVYLYSGDRVVEYGVIEIELGNLSVEARDQVLAGRKPLGGILNELDVSYTSSPDAFLKICGGDFFEGECGGKVNFGRRNTLRNETGQVIARILEILPYLESES